jgi:hypothetical protein
MNDQTSSKVVYFDDFPFAFPLIPQPIPPFQCCNGVHKGVGCDHEIIAHYPEQTKTVPTQSEVEIQIKMPIPEPRQMTFTPSLSAQKRTLNASLPINVQTPEIKKAKPSTTGYSNPTSTLDSQNR